MKAKLYVSGTKMEIRLSDDSVHTPNKKESKEAFLARVQVIVNDEHLDDEFVVVEITKDVVAMNDDAALAVALESAEGLQKELIQAVLADRKPAAEAKVKKVAAPAVSVEVAKATPAYKAAEANIGKYVTFSPFKSLEVFQGKIAGVALNKTNTIIYYTVVEANGKRRCCGVLNESVTFIEAPIVEAKPVVAKVSKAEAKKAAAEAEALAAAELVGADLGEDLN
jgi:hypothetical protein